MYDKYNEQDYEDEYVEKIRSKKHKGLTGINTKGKSVFTNKPKRQDEVGKIRRDLERNRKNEE